MKQVRVQLGNGDKAVFRSSRRASAVAYTAESVEGDKTSGKSREAAETNAPRPELTEIDRAYSAMIDGGEAELRQFYETIVASELVVLLDEPVGAEAPEPKVVSIDGGQCVLVFDRDERAATLAGHDASRSSVPGHGLFTKLRGQGVGVAVNMGDTPSAMLIPSDAIDWICETFKTPAPAAPAPAPTPGKFKALMAPRNFPDTLHLALNEELSRMTPMFGKALLLRAEYEDGQSGYLVAFSDVDETSFSALSDVVNAALASCRTKDIMLDIAFLDSDEPLFERICRVATLLKPAAARLQKRDA